jgi:hypothetical protein
MKMIKQYSKLILVGVNIRIPALLVRSGIGVPTNDLLSPRGVGEKPSHLGEDFSSIFLPQGFKGQK